MSGGVDSSVAAALLVEAGYEVIGATMKLFCYGDAVPDRPCCSLDSITDAQLVAHKLGTPHVAGRAHQAGDARRGPAARARHRRQARVGGNLLRPRRRLRRCARASPADRRPGARPRPGRHGGWRGGGRTPGVRALHDRSAPRASRWLRASDVRRRHPPRDARSRDRLGGRAVRPRRRAHRAQLARRSAGAWSRRAGAVPLSRPSRPGARRPLRGRHAGARACRAGARDHARAVGCAVRRRRAPARRGRHRVGAPRHSLSPSCRVGWASLTAPATDFPPTTGGRSMSAFRHTWWALAAAALVVSACKDGTAPQLSNPQQLGSNLQTVSSVFGSPAFQSFGALDSAPGSPVAPSTAAGALLSATSVAAPQTPRQPYADAPARLQAFRTTATALGGRLSAPVIPSAVWGQTCVWGVTTHAYAEDTSPAVAGPSSGVRLILYA